MTWGEFIERAAFVAAFVVIIGSMLYLALCP
jgi:hypothetical protein